MYDEPIVTWLMGENKKENEIKGAYSFGKIKTNEKSDEKRIFLWNNFGGEEDCPTMEEVKYTVRDLDGGTGDTSGNIVEAVRDNWYELRVHSLEEEEYTRVGKGNDDNPTGEKELGTNGTSINLNAEKAETWEPGEVYGEGDIISPVGDSDEVFRVIVAGTSAQDEPSWGTEEGEQVSDGSIIYVTEKKIRKANPGEILGYKNNTKEDGSNVEDAAANFVEIGLRVEVPAVATSGANRSRHRVLYSHV